ncbi:MAG: 1-deoxy-D-xylulose-5-phosphate synthase [Lentisphaeria bacterium]|nr:1-deoxy-D-xylulose-5-phosphate synthase [Lentisphaeria bacterium]
MAENLSQQLKNYSLDELKGLSQKIRQEIIDSVSVNGGHLSPNLGVVELTIALHKVFNFPQDSLIFDVGHQAYTHKILSGRAEEFKKVRQFDSISGFPHPDESEYDSFIAGHAGAALSAAMGIAESKVLTSDASETIAVIGDGSIGNGMTLEALNNLKSIKGKVIVILNDNKMAISPNVGSIAAHLNKIISGSWYLHNKGKVKNFLRKISFGRVRFDEIINNALRAIKNLILPKGTIFNALNIRYLGPIDGYNYTDLFRTLEFAKNVKESVIIHVFTEKGHGYEYARNFPEKFHGIGAFHKNDGSLCKESLQSFPKTFGFTMCELAQKNLAVITAAMKSGTALTKYAEENPDNFYDVGICEEHAVTFAAGLAKSGKTKSVVALYSTFLQRAFDSVYHDVCLQTANVLIAIDRAGIVDDGPTHHGIYDLGFLREMPNLTIMVPRSENELRSMLHLAMEIPAPVAIRYSKGASRTPFTPELPPEKIDIGRAEIAAEGEIISLWAMGSEVDRALEIRDLIKEKIGVAIEVVNVRFIRPFDKKLLFYRAKSHLIVTMEDHCINGGLASEVSQLIAPSCYDLAASFGWQSRVFEHGNTNEIRKKHGLDNESIAAKLVELIENER